MNSFKKIPIGIFPTPLVKLENLSKQLNTNVWIKRDDLCGIALGGNKVRKLEYLLADAKAQGYELVMTTGQAQSNHAMLTAACAKKLGMECVLVLKKRGITARKGNQLLNYLMGVDVVFVDSDNYDDIYAEMDKIAEERGKKVYKIPCGGSNALGSVGYVDCMREISESGINFDYIVTACGSGGTAAGTMLGAAIYMPKTHVIAGMVDNDPFDEIVTGIMRESAALLGLNAVFAASPEAGLCPGDSEASDTVLLPVPDFVNMTGPGYSIPSKEGIEAISLMMSTEGIVLDTCYTGKAFAALLKRAREGYFKPQDNVLFIHTGGAGGLFAQEW